MPPAELAFELNRIMEAERVPETGGLVQTGSASRINRLGLTLDWDDVAAAWARREYLDAVWVHRTTDRDPEFHPALTVLRHHAAFDRRYGLGANATLHLDLAASNVTVLSERPALSIVRLAHPIAQADLAEHMRARYGGIERTYGYGTRLTILALADAMHAELLNAASSAGAELYLTGQWRPNAEPAAEAAGISVITLGHAPMERRGMQDMSAELAATLPGLTILLNQ